MFDARHALVAMAAAGGLTVACAARPVTPGEQPARAPAALCGDARIAFACPLQRQGWAAVCVASDGSGHLVGPDGGRAASPRHTRLSFTGGTGGYAFSTEDGGVRRVVYSISGSRGFEEQGYLEQAAGASRARRHDRCQPGSAEAPDDAALLDAIERWPTDVELQTRGLPERQ